MEFKLNDYHQGVTDEELLNDVKRVSELVGDVYISTSLYKQHGKYGGTTFIKRFGSWLNVLEKLGLRTERNSTEMKRISDKALVKDLLRVSELLDKKIVTSTEYYDHGKYSSPTITERFGTWSNFVDKAGLEQTGFIRKIEDEELFSEIERIWTTLGKQPTTTDMKKGISKYSLDSFTRRFGGWRNALTAFIEYVKSDDNSEKEDTKSPSVEEVEVPVTEKEVAKPRNIIPKRTPRNINLKLRFKVLLRDNFKCCYCGASPAKDPNVILHVDHILPWSKGGETELENLQAACSTCNLGKNNLVHH
jgi:hypothetical protein